MTEKVLMTQRKCLWIRPGVKLALRMNEETLVSILTVGEHPAKTNRIAIQPLAMKKKKKLLNLRSEFLKNGSTSYYTIPYLIIRPLLHLCP
jgi:hypothetical protein